MSFREDVIIPRARALGLPDDVTPQDLQDHVRAKVVREINNPNSRSVRFIPTPAEAQTEAAVIEVSQPLSSEQFALASVSEDAGETYRNSIRFELAKTIVAQLLQAGWISVRVGGNCAIAALTVVQPKG